MTALGIALEALERLAARGILTVNTVDKAADSDDESPVCPKHGPIFDRGVICMCGEFQCPECGGFQPSAGPCVDEDCPTAIARRALQDIKRAA